MKIALVNDTSSTPHFGCRIVSEALKARLDPIVCVDIRDQWWNHGKALESCDLVVVNGEGCLHHGRRMDLLELADHFPSALVNAVYQDMPRNPHLQRFKYVAARESYSAFEMAKQRDKPICVVPDLLFAAPLEKGDGSAGTVITDSVNHGGGIGAQPANLQQILNAERLVAGRFHAVCAAMLCGIPFTAYGTNSWKTEALLSDAGLSHLYHEDPAVAA